MSQQLALSRISELRQEISSIANVPKASRDKAIQYAMRLVSQHPGQQNQDERVAKMFMLDLTACLEGVDLDVLEKLVDPKRVRSKWLPSVPEVAAFIDEKMEPKRVSIGFMLDEIAYLERRETTEAVSPEERARRADMLKRAAAVIRDAAYKKSPLRPMQAQEGPELNEARLKALRSLEAMRRAE
jgi:hypothetical protein